MNVDEKSKTLFLNGKEIDSFDLTGDESKDMAAAKKFLAEQDMEDARRQKQAPAEASQDCLVPADRIDRYASNGIPT